MLLIIKGVKSMSKSRIAALCVILAALVIGVFSLTHTSGSHAASSSGKRTYKVHVTNDPDSGTCGNNWATDAFDRVFVVSLNNPYVFTELFQNGKFQTTAGQSPGACEFGPANANTVGGNVVGTFHGNEPNVVVTGGTFNPNAKCTTATCGTTTGFCTTVYGVGANCAVSSFDFDYTTPENGGWHNGSSDLGGTNGDITGSATEQNTPVHKTNVPHL